MLLTSYLDLSVPHKLGNTSTSCMHITYRLVLTKKIRSIDCEPPDSTRRNVAAFRAAGERCGRNDVQQRVLGRCESHIRAERRNLSEQAAGPRFISRSEIFIQEFSFTIVILSASAQAESPVSEA